MADSRSNNKLPDSDGSWVMTMPLSDGMTSLVWPSELIHRIFPGVFGAESLGGPGWTAAGRIWSVMLTGSGTRVGVVRSPAVCCSIWDTVSDWRDFVRTITCAEELDLYKINSVRQIWWLLLQSAPKHTDNSAVIQTYLIGKILLNTL